jgi:hypothetical protein
MFVASMIASCIGRLRGGDREGELKSAAARPGKVVVLSADRERPLFAAIRQLSPPASHWASRAARVEVDVAPGDCLDGRWRERAASLTDAVFLCKEPKPSTRTCDTWDFRSHRRPSICATNRSLPRRRRSNTPSPNLEARWRQHWRRFAFGELRIWVRSRSFRRAAKGQPHWLA